MVFAATAKNTPTLENGCYFYFTASKSIGFAPNSTINQDSADIENAPTFGSCDAGNGDLRLSWHLGEDGWRAGCSDWLQGSSEPRAVYQSSSSSSLFTGPAKNVSHQTLLDNGWSLCYDDTYAVALASDGSGLTSVCTQTYVLLAGGDGVAGPQPSFQIASSPAEAEAGPPGIALTVPNALGRDSAGLPIYFGSHKTSSYGAYSLELTGPQGRTVLASGKSSVYGGYVGMVRLPAGLPGGSYVLSLKNTSAAGIPLVLKVNLTLDASSRLQSHSPG